MGVHSTPSRLTAVGRRYLPCAKKLVTGAPTDLSWWKNRLRPRPEYRFVVGLIALSWLSAPACVTLSDALGRQISLPGEPQRIVALAPSLTEMLFFLGVGDRLVGVTKFSSYPPQAAGITKVGSYVDVNVERVLSLSPDLVVATVDGNQPDKIALLEQAGLPVFVVNPRNIRQVIDTMVTLGHLCGVAEKAAVLAREMSVRVDTIVAKTAPLPKPLVFLQINARPIMSVNQNTFLHDLIRLAGGRNMAAEQPITYPRISLEEVIRRKPEVIIISSMQRDGDFDASRQHWMRWPMIPAVSNGRVHLVDSDLTDRPSPRVIQGLEVLARHLHPQAAWDD